MSISPPHRADDNPAACEPFWTPLDHFQGAVHAADRNHPGYCPSFLLVFVHGILSTHETAWLDRKLDIDLPRDLLKKLGVDIDILNFRYPSLWCHRGSPVDAAGRLATCLNAHFPQHRNILFFTHSNGGLVVKRYLADRHRQGVRQLDRVVTDRDHTFDPAHAMHTAWGRTRCVINFDVPHFGGVFWKTAVGITASSLVGPPLVFAELCREVLRTRFKISVAAPALGWNWFPWHLCPLNPGLGRLHRTHLDQLEEQKSRLYPRPSVRDVLAVEEGVIRPPVRTQVQYLDDIEAWRDEDGRLYQTLPGDHSSLKRPSGYEWNTLFSLLVGSPTVALHDDRPISHSPNRLLGNITDWRSVVVAEVTLRLLLTTRLARVDRLIGPSAAVMESSSEHREDRSQTEVLAGILRRLADERVRIHLVGSVGVGKSTVLRWLVRQLSADYLANFFSTASWLPLFFQLKGYKLQVDETEFQGIPEGERGRWLWTQFVNTWCRDANRLHGEDDRGPFNGEWVKTRLADRGRKTLVVLDSIDDFLTNHILMFTLDDIREALNEFERWAEGNPNVSLIVATRLSLEDPANAALMPETLGPRALLGVNQRTAPLDPMSPTDCRQSFPVVGRVLDDVSEDVRHLLLTPLLAHHFNSTRLDPTALANRLLDRGATFMVALEELLRESGLTNRGRETDDMPDTFAPTTWVAALATVNYWMFNRLLPAITEADMIRAGRAVATTWAANPRTAVAHGAAVLGCEPLRHLLLTRTILKPSYGSDTSQGGSAISYEIYHREFADYLTAWYLAECIRHGRHSDIKHRGHSNPVFTLAGQLLHQAGFALRGMDVHALVTGAREDGNWGAFGNVVTVVGNSSVPLIDRAAQELLNGLWIEVLPPLDLRWWDFVTVRLITLMALCRRAFAGRAHNDALYLAMVDPPRERDVTLWTFLAADEDGRVDSLTRSLAWSYLEAFAVYDSTVLERLTEYPRPEPRWDDAARILRPSGPSGLDADLDVLDPAGRERLAWYERRFRAHHRGFLSFARCIGRRDGIHSGMEAFTNGDRLINVLHLAFCLTAVLTRGDLLDGVVGSPELGIRPVFAEGSPLEAAVTSQLTLDPTRESLLCLFNLIRARLGGQPLFIS